MIPRIYRVVGRLVQSRFGVVQSPRYRFGCGSIASRWMVDPIARRRLRAPFEPAATEQNEIIDK